MDADHLLKPWRVEPSVYVLAVSVRQSEVLAQAVSHNVVRCEVHAVEPLADDGNAPGPHREARDSEA